MSRNPPNGPRGFPGSRARPTLNPGTGQPAGNLKITIELMPDGNVALNVNQTVTPFQLMGLFTTIVQSQITALANQAALIIDPNRKPAVPEVEPEKEVTDGGA